MYGLNLQKIPNRNAIEVESRIARASYGVSYDEEWVLGKHAAKDKIWSDIHQCNMAANMMRWFLKQVRQTLRTLHFLSTEHRLLTLRNPGAIN